MSHSRLPWSLSASPLYPDAVVDADDNLVCICEDHRDADAIVVMSRAGDVPERDELAAENARLEEELAELEGKLADAAESLKTLMHIATEIAAYGSCDCDVENDEVCVYCLALTITKD